MFALAKVAGGEYLVRYCDNCCARPPSWLQTDVSTCVTGTDEVTMFVGVKTIFVVGTEEEVPGPALIFGVEDEVPCSVEDVPASVTSTEEEGTCTVEEVLITKDGVVVVVCETEVSMKTLSS